MPEKGVLMTFQWQDKRWHVRLYLWAEPIVAEFFDRGSHVYHYRKSYEVHTNLCPYMRTILLWLPLALLVNVATWAMAVATVTYIPGRLFGWKGWGLTVLVTAAGVGLLLLMLWLRQWYRERQEARPPKVPDVGPHDRTPGFGSAVREWVRKKHEGICPSITIKVGGGTE
jgi:hypothetical protein